MSTPRPPLSRLSDLRPGDQADFFAVLLDRTRGLTREARPYFHCRFADLRRTVSLMAWSDDRWFVPAERDWVPGSFYKLRALYTEHDKYGPQIELRNIRPVEDGDQADGFDPALLVETSSREPTFLLGEIRALAMTSIQNEPLRQLVLDLLEMYAEDLLLLPATRDRAYPYRGGWLEHTLHSTRTALELGTRYQAIHQALRPPLNLDLIVAGTLLHAIGRVVELTPGPDHEWTIPGRLFGSAVLGRDLVRDAARGRDIHPELLLLLEHILITPLYPAENAGPRWPLVPEGLIVQYATDLDLRLAHYARALQRDTGAGPFTERDPVLGRPLLRAREV